MSISEASKSILLRRTILVDHSCTKYSKTHLLMAEGLNVKSSTLGPGNKYDTTQCIVTEEIIHRKTKCHSKYHVATILVHYEQIPTQTSIFDV